MPVQLSADRMRLLDGAGDDVLELTSSPENPARFDIGDGFFIGRTINVRPSENIIWIPEAGEFQIPTDILPTGIANASQPETIKWTHPPYCRWQGEMMFDGHTIVLSDGVDITAAMLNGREPWEFRMEGDQLKVNLWEDVALSDFGSLRDAKVQSISLIQSGQRPVMVHALQRAADGVLEAKHLLQAQQLTLLPGAEEATAASNGNGAASTGKLVGSGPGWYRGWMPAKDSGAMKMDPRATMIDDAQRPLTGVHLTFNDAMDANLKTRSLNFSRGVRVGIKAVSHWEETFQADQMDSLAVDETTLDCDQLQLTLEPRSQSRYVAAPAAMPWEVQAISGIVFRTRSDRGLFETTASRVSYAASKDMFTLYGAPSRPAVIKSFAPDGTPRSDSSVRSAVIRPRTMTFESIEFESVNLATPANFAKPQPGSYR